MKEERKRLQDLIDKLTIQNALLVERNEFLSRKTTEQEQAITRYTEKLAELLQKRFPKEEKPVLEWPRQN